MKTITIKIVKKSVMGVVEGLSATIAQHNPEVDFQSIWASDAEEAKLDIYYRESITDLESFLARFSSSTTQQFDLQALADDFEITIKTLAYWPSRLSGVLTNQVQNYLVHAIMAGWLNDFPDISHTDYASMGVSDLDAIKEILLKKDFNFAESKRSLDNVNKSITTCSSVARKDDETEKANKEVSVSTRKADDIENVKSSLVATLRYTDDIGKESMDETVGKRQVDDGKRINSTAEAQARNKDNASQCFQHEHVDWSGGRPPFELR